MRRYKTTKWRLLVRQMREMWRVWRHEEGLHRILRPGAGWHFTLPCLHLLQWMHCQTKVDKIQVKKSLRQVFGTLQNWGMLGNWRSSMTVLLSVLNSVQWRTVIRQDARISSEQLGLEVSRYVVQCSVEVYFWRCPPFSSRIWSRIISRTWNMSWKCICLSNF